MKQLLIIGANIIAQGPFEETENEIISLDSILPKNVLANMGDWEIVEIELPEDFAPGIYEYVDNELVAKPVPVFKEVPEKVTMRQARLALLAIGKLADVEAAIAALPSGAIQAKAQIEWEYSQEVYRNWPLVKMLGPILGFTEDQLDDLFIEASKL